MFPIFKLDKHYAQFYRSICKPVKINSFKDKKSSKGHSDLSVMKQSEFRFKYDFSAVGEVTGSISYNERCVHYTLNNSSNPLLLLLKGMINIIFEPSHIWDEDNVSWIDWYEEAGGLKWVLSTDDGQSINVKIIAYDDFFDESSGHVALDIRLGLLDFYYAVIHRLDIFIKKVGLLNYEQKWQTDEFPLTYFLLLKRHLIEKGHWVPTKERLGTLNDEIDFLLT